MIETPARSCLPVSSAELFKNTFLLEHPWASASDFIFDIFKSNKYMKVIFLETVVSQKK